MVLILSSLCLDAGENEYSYRKTGFYKIHPWTRRETLPFYYFHVFVFSLHE